MAGPDTRGEELIGKTLRGYRIEHRLGAGATGVVFRVQRDDEPTPLALKVLHENLGSISSLKRRFEREARVLAKLEHPNVVHITDFGVVDGHTFIAMELLEGLTLEELLDASPVSAARAIDITCEVLKGLAFAHERSVVHRDLKPANVFLCRGGHDGVPDSDRVKLLDFGLAKILSDDEVAEGGTLTRRGRIVGTPAYMAPEQITGVSLDVRADVYAAGILLYELLADRRPFLSDRRSELLRAHLLEPVPPLSVARAGLVVHPELEGVVMKALEKDPAARFPNARAMLDAIVALPPDLVTLERPSASQKRARAGATSEVITSGERRAVSESISGDTLSQPRAAPLEVGTSGPSGLTPSSSASASGGLAAVLSSNIPEAPSRSPAARGASAVDITQPARRAGPAARSAGQRVGDAPAISTPMLYVLATSLFAMAALLWWALSPS